MKKNFPYDPSRRSFLKKTAKGGSFLFMDPFSIERGQVPDEEIRLPESLNSLEGYARKLNLAPARWIWYPSRRTLPNTVFHFRKTFQFPGKLTGAVGWILGESRYQLYVNGQRVQFGPAPNDPRYSEADSMDLKNYLKQGDNCIGVEILFYGHGDGTWPIGKPGFIFKLDITPEEGSPLQIVSDGSWDCEVTPAWKPGQYKRWYLRAFQEEFDNRYYPDQWHTTNYNLSESWRKAMELNNPANLPALCSDYPEYMLEIQGQPDRCELRERTIPPILEKDVFSRNLTEKKQLRWIHSPETYFMMVTPDAYEVAGDLDINEEDEQTWSLAINPGFAGLLTFEFDEQTVGFPFFSIEATEGTVVELLVQEGHETGTEDPLMNNHFHSWTRFICKKGLNHFRTFDYESLRWLQLHIRNAEGKLKISNVGIKRRRYDWPNQPEVEINDPRVQQVIDASINTIHNAAQETIVDGMGRERQQYSGDVGHQLHAIFYTFGEYRLPARYLNTYSQGLTYDGYFLDSWPAYDRLARLMERQLDLTPWGPILDHSVGFNFDNYYYYLYTGDLNALKEVYPRLLVFKNYLKKLSSEHDGLLPVENLGIPYVWIDHNAYREQKHKQCAFNLYAAAMLSHALAPLCESLGDSHNQKDAAEFSIRLLEGVMEKFYSRSDQMLIVNKPWLSMEAGNRYCDRSLATAILFNQIPEAARKKALKMLVEKPAAMGLSYPANAGWRYWALAKGNRMDVVVDEIRNIWAEMPSVKLNNTLQEDWEVHPDSSSQWSHCPVAPLYLVYMGLLGLHPLSPGFGKIRIRPQLGDISSVRIVANTTRGPVRIETQGLAGNRILMVMLPAEMSGELELNPGEKVKLKEIENSDPTFRKYLIPGGKNITLKLKYT
jgi:alpha-L-rhamnosidase